MNPEQLKAAVDLWFSWDKNDTTIREVQGLVALNNNATLQKLFGSRMEFGTAGLRAAMGAGTSQMNDVTVIQAAQGLAAYLKTQFTASDLTDRGIVIGNDARHNSSRFARLSANVFLAKGIKTYLFPDIVCTPYVPFTVRRRGCVAGVMVTASHNPKQDNGYKVYWSNGAQIIGPHDSGIAKCIEENLNPQTTSWETQPGAIDPTEDTAAAYFESLAELCLHKDVALKSTTKFTYTAMHGVGTRFATRSLSTFGVRPENIVYVKEQVEPDPEFPTVAFPNPEEGKSALNLAFATADAHNSRVILANDPDADRLAVAERQEDGAWRVFTGNHIGALFGWWALERYKRSGKIVDSNVAMVSSAVSSMILRSMAQQEGFTFEETLTGFKWMGSRSEILEREQHKTVLFAFEEAIGFMFGTRVFDKDGITAAAVMADMVHDLELNENGKRLSTKLEDIYRQYGFHASYNSYVVSKDSAKTRVMFDSMRTLGLDGGYPSTVAGVAVTSIRDLSVGLDTSRPDGLALLPSSAVSPMITFYFENKSVLTIRGSGTEPKIKWYAEMISTNGASCEAELVEFVTAAVGELMRPNEFGFLPRPT
jgi:phosphoglucomutase / phosphopentomutase